MAHHVHGSDPGKMAHRTYKILEPDGEIAVAQRPQGVLKVVIYTGSGEKKKQHHEFTMERQAAFDFAMEMLQHAYRLGEGL
jgi:hypothetical protein